jgi:hypothetical protein
MMGLALRVELEHDPCSALKVSGGLMAFGQESAESFENPFQMLRLCLCLVQFSE